MVYGLSRKTVDRRVGWARTLSSDQRASFGGWDTKIESGCVDNHTAPRTKSIGESSAAR